MANGFKINQQAVRKMTRELQRSIDKEMARNPVKIPAEVTPDYGFTAFPSPNVTNYNGPVVTVTGGQAQIAWGNNAVTQGQSSSSEVAPGYEQLAQVITVLLANLPALGLDTDDDAEVRTAAGAVLAEVVHEAPDSGLIKRSLALIKGYIAQIATGAAQAATDEGVEIARHAIEELSNSLPF